MAAYVTVARGCPRRRLGEAKDGLSEALESDRANLFGGDASLQRDIAKGAHRVFE
jgi:hypothetical protein